jgi:hypothetical protein
MSRAKIARLAAAVRQVKAQRAAAALGACGVIVVNEQRHEEPEVLQPRCDAAVLEAARKAGLSSWPAELEPLVAVITDLGCPDGECPRCDAKRAKAHAAALSAGRGT